MTTSWKVVTTLIFIAAPATAEPIQLRCDNLSLSRPDRAVYSVLQIELDKSSITQTNYYPAGSNRVPYKITAASETMISAVSDHEGTRKMRIDRTTGRVEVTHQYRSVTLSGGQMMPAGVVNLVLECKPLKPVF